MGFILRLPGWLYSFVKPAPGLSTNESVDLASVAEGFSLRAFVISVGHRHTNAYISQSSAWVRFRDRFPIFRLHQNQDIVHALVRISD